MMNRLKLALKALRGEPLMGIALDGALLLKSPEESECDYATTPPLDLVFGDHVGHGPPDKVLQEERFRVCVFKGKESEACDGCGRPTSWLTLELRGKDRWLHLVTMHESRLGIMLSVLNDAAAFVHPTHAAEKPTARRP